MYSIRYEYKASGNSNEWSRVTNHTDYLTTLTTLTEWSRVTNHTDYTNYTHYTNRME